MRAYLTLRQVAGRLGKTPAWMYRHVKRLQAAHGFPLRDNAMGGFDPRAITDWQNRRAGFAPPLTTTIDMPAIEDLAQWGAELDRRAGGLN